jgi:lysophospholipase L1-like esterase
VLFPGRTVFDGGVAAQDSIGVRARMVADTSRHNWISVFWFGHNNASSPAQIKADIAACIAALSPGNSRFIVMSLLNEAKPDQLKGTAEYQNRIQINNDLAAAYPSNYLDIRAYLVSLYNPGIPQDVIDHNNDVMPSSVRHDEGHLNNDGSVAVARKVQEFINARGW